MMYPFTFRLYGVEVKQVLKQISTYSPCLHKSEELQAHLAEVTALYEILDSNFLSTQKRGIDRAYATPSPETC
jgi:hypothetical protein